MTNNKQEYKTIRLVKCNFCKFTWVPKVENPKECPSCKRRRDHEPKKKK